MTLLIDPRFEKPVLDVPLSGSYWKTTLFESNPQISGILNQEAEQLATHKTNDFLLEQEADLFHLTNPFVSAIAIGYPPCVCPGVATVYDVAGLYDPDFAEDGRVAATFYVKGQALRYCSRIVVNSQSAANEFMKWTDLPASRIDLIDDALSPLESALAIRQTYNKTLTSPFIMTSSGLVFPPDIPESDFGLNKLPSLAAQADVADREYTVRSHLPVVGPVIAGVRRKMTYHLREQYFDPLIEQQVSFNKKMVEGLQLVGQPVADYEKVIKYKGDQNNLQDLHPSQDIIDEATEKTKEHDVLNPYLLAGPLPEYGDCLGHHFYEQLYKATLISMPDVSEGQKQINQSVIIALHKLAQQAEAYYEQRQSLRITQLLQPKQRLKIVESLLDWLLSIYKNSTLREHKSDHPHISRLGVAPHLSVPLREHYIEPIVQKQERFNRLLVASLCDLYLVKPIRLKQLEDAVKNTWDSSVAYSTKPIVGPLITWLQKNSMSHLQYPYITPIFQRQELFNHAVVSILAKINQQLTIISLYEHYDQIISKFEIKQGLKELKERNFAAIDEYGGSVKASAEQTEFIYQFLYLIEQIKIEGGL
ncbi:MAG: hypothetical protein ACPGWR_10575 [Ardenticatenaceae bacterium]